jgi:hypothetical protein
MALTLKNPAADLAAALAGQTVGGVGLVVGENLFYHLVHPMPMGLVVRLLNTGGPPPVPYLSPTSSSFYAATVQCLVYGMPGDDGFASGEELARGVAGFLHQLIPSGYVTVFVRDAQPVLLPPDGDTQRHAWSLNFEVQYVA